MMRCKQRNCSVGGAGYWSKADVARDAPNWWPLACLCGSARLESKPADMRWTWSITVYVWPDAGIPTSGKAPTLDQAKAEFQRNWLAWTRRKHQRAPCCPLSLAFARALARVLAARAFARRALARAFARAAARFSRHLSHLQPRVVMTLR